MTESAAKQRVFLVVVDESPELRVALHYACLRAKKSGGRVALLYVMEPSDGQQWIAVEDIMRQEKRELAEKTLGDLSAEVVTWSGAVPVIYLREGIVRDELLKLIEEEPSISILVLAAAAGSDGPGPLISHLASKVVGRLRVPLTIVPGVLGDEQLAAIT